MSQPTGKGRLALSLGASDPRSRRGLAQPLSGPSAMLEPLYVERDGRQALRRARSVAKFESPRDASESKLNEIIDSLRAGGFME